MSENLIFKRRFWWLDFGEKLCKNYFQKNFMSENHEKNMQK